MNNSPLGKSDWTPRSCETAYRKMGTRGRERDNNKVGIHLCIASIDVQSFVSYPVNALFLFLFILMVSHFPSFDELAMKVGTLVSNSAWNQT